MHLTFSRVTKNVQQKLSRAKKLLGVIQHQQKSLVVQIGEQLFAGISIFFKAYPERVPDAAHKRIGAACWFYADHKDAVGETCQ